MLPRQQTHQTHFCGALVWAGSSSASAAGQRSRCVSFATATIGVPSFSVPRKLLLLLFVLVDTGQALVMDWAEKRSWDQKRAGRQYARQTALVFESCLSICTGLSFAFACGGWEVAKQCFSPALMIKFLPVACCFALGLSLKMMAVNHFQAGTIKITGQLRLPLMAVVSCSLLGRRYSAIQWQVIALISMSCVSFVLVKGQGRLQSGRNMKLFGWSQLLGWTGLNVLGGILAEKTYKSGLAPYYVQKVAQDFGHLLTSTVMLFLVVPRFNPEEDILDRKARPGGFFDSWDFRTLAVVGFLFLDAWIGNLLLKEFSGVTRAVAKAFAVAAVYLVSLLYAKDRLSNPALTLMAVMVIQSSILYAFVS